MRLYNVDHQTAVIDTHISVRPGESWDFTDEQIAAGLSGRWVQKNPRSGLPAEEKFKQRRDKSPEGEQTTDPAQPDETQE